MIRSTIRRSIRWFTTHIPVRGRHKLADKLGALVAPVGPGVERIHGIAVEFDHRILSHRMMYYGLYEENVMNFLRSYLRPGMIVMDPGANMGYFAACCLGMVLPGGHVYSFEPSNTCLQRLRAHNDLDHVPGWTLLPMAITDVVGMQTFYDTPRVTTRGFACLEGVYDPKDKMPHPVQVTTVDAFCSERRIDRIDFLKLDIEGSELPALKGAHRMLADRRIAAMLVETTLIDHTRELVIEIDDTLRGAGFLPYQALRNGRLVPIDVLAHRELRMDVLWLPDTTS
ncbi:MAG: FkbM family methyltransferase [Flavobacteriales bacterium]|nr:FkbM family methyltransferase [Flavobacteriales bacterium]MCB9193874.1 FkbM family methyltransferase [Flavobacteriales bacterium]